MSRPPARKRKECLTEKPSATLPATVEKVIKSRLPSEPDKVQISVEGADQLYRELRIENSLTDQDGKKLLSGRAPRSK